MTSKLSPTDSSQAEVLYGSTDFQVCLHRLGTDEAQESCPQAPVSKAQLFVINGPLTACDANGEQTAITKGQRLEVRSSQPQRIVNRTESPVSFVSVAWGNGFQPCPLREITETRPWGSFTVLKDEPDYKLKQLAVNPGNRLSLQRHEKREEHWLVTAGHPEVTLDEDIVKLAPGDYIRIPRHSWHRISNPADNQTVVEIIELQLGDYFGEDDIERRQDDYGRS